MSGEGVMPSPSPARGQVEMPPLITFAEAEAIGVALHDHLEKVGVRPPMTRDDMGWGDVVQFVLRRASETALDRANRETD